MVVKKDSNLTTKEDNCSIRGRHFLLTVPHLNSTPEIVLDLLKTYQQDFDYIKYAIVFQTHTLDPSKGKHLHLYLCYPKQYRLQLDRFDYLGNHGKLQRVRDYTSVLKYMIKQNLPTANFDYIETIMKKDFSRAIQILMNQGLTIREIYKKYSSIAASKNWSGYLRFLQFQKDSQKFEDERKKPGLRYITQELIKTRLTPEELELYYSKPEYSRIVHYVNDIVRYGCTRPHKTKNILLTGAPNTGKTTFGLALQKLVGTFTFPDDGWWQGYEADVFKMIMWNEFNLARFSYPTLLKFLQGLRMDLPIKGSHVTRSDNPLIFLTSNLTLDELILRRFSSEENIRLSRANLAARIECINIGSNPIFFLTKLLVSPKEDIKV